jgi:hypothetical protein
VSLPLPPYSPASACSKCAAESISTVFHPRPVLDLGELWACAAERPPGEHLCRRCLNCGFTWIEACADSYPQWEEPSEEAP